MKRVTGLGGIFFKSRDPKALSAWYSRRLGIDIEEWGGAVFHWKGPANPDGVGTTIWSPFPDDASHFSAPFMINYRVHDLHALLETLRAEGVQVEEAVEESEYGKFGWVIDPDGNRVELWQPPEGR